MPIYLVHLELTAGHGVEIQRLPAPDVLVNGSAFYSRYTDDPSVTYYLEMIGHLMEPTIKAGDKILMRPCEGEPIREGAVYLMSGLGGVRINRLKYKGVQIVVYGDNPSFETSLFEPERFHELFTLHAVARSSERRL